MNTKPTTCTLPPAGYYCTREPGHQGPCAAYPTAWPELASKLETAKGTMTEELRKLFAPFIAALGTMKSDGHHHLTAEEYAAHAGDVAKSFRKGYDSPVETVPITITLTGHQLVQALDLLAPGLPRDPEELDNDLTFGVVQHKDDYGVAVTSMCCWNGDTDGVLPLEEHPEATAPRAAVATTAPQVRAVDFDPSQPPSAGAVSPEVTSLIADVKKALQIANKVGISRQPNGYAINHTAVGELVNLQISIEDRIKQLGRGAT